jgi:two-component system, LytTR family, sensor kinase
MTKLLTHNRNYLREYGIIVCLTIFGYWVRYFSGLFTSEFNIILLFTSFVLISSSWEFLTYANTLLNKIFPFERSIPGRIAIQLAAGTLFALSARLLVSLFGEPLLTQPLDKLFLVSTWLLYVLGVAVINSIFFTTYFIKRWKDSILEAEQLEKEKVIMQFENLKNQLNPHFLFNALTSLNSLIAENQQLASQFLQQLSKIYRYILQHKDSGLVTLKTEMDFIHNYVSLAETRFQSSLKIGFNVPQPLPDKSIVPVTIQVLIENALKHNRIDDQSPLRISITIDDQYLTVTNNLQPRKIVDTSNKQGLEHLKSLYGFFSVKPVLVQPTSDIFSVSVPLI